MKNRLGKIKTSIINDKCYIKMKIKGASKEHTIKALETVLANIKGVEKQ